LNIEKITPDRRIERGGCLAKAGDQMWDASLRGQLDALTELVDEIMSSENVPEENVDGEPDSSLA
jgi:flagellar biosynthesis/type III secretory pathway protein FliH